MINKDLTIYKEKIEVYRHYLDVYLNIVTKVSKDKDINVYEPLSGDGKDQHFYGEFQYDGSVKAAINIIEKHRKDSKCQIKYFINDNDTNKHKKSQEKYKDYEWVNISKLDAKTFINNYASVGGSHNLWFIDPYGYTQVEKEDIDKIIFSHNKSDIIIFFPTIFITRFISDPDSEETPAPIKKFFQDWGIKYQGMEDINDPEICEEIIKDAMKSNYPKHYISSYTLKKDSNIHTFSLFFISKHPLGAEKFLETKDKLSEQDKQIEIPYNNNLTQQYEEELEELIKEFLKEEKTNREIYIWGLRNELSTKYFNKLLRKLESENTITIKLARQENKRNNKSFYIGYRYYKEKIDHLIYKIASPEDIHNPDNDLFQSVPYPNK